MNDATVSDACLEFVPLTTADRAEQQTIALWVDGEKVPHLRQVTISEHEVEVTAVPCRAHNRLKSLSRELRRVPVEYTCRKIKLTGHGLVMFVGERICWPSCVSEVVVRIGVDAGWKSEPMV